MSDASAQRADPAAHRRHHGDYRWEGVDVHAYKELPAAGEQAVGALFRDVTRQVLLEAPGLACQLRYFEVEAGGHSTLERHEHVHGVMVLRGRGRCLVGSEVIDIDAHDLVTVPPMTWHQFRADDEPLGFLCLVNTERDRPVLPTEVDLEELRRHPDVAGFIRV